MKTWFQIGSELFVNLAAGWFAIVFIEPQVSELTPETILVLTARLVVGILSLYAAKKLREEAERRKK